MPTSAPTVCVKCQRAGCDCKRVSYPDQREKNSNARGYTSRWRRFAKNYLNRNPLCVHCRKSGRVTPATEVDHIIPHRGDQELFWDTENNLQGLCKECHSRKTGRGE